MRYLKTIYWNYKLIGYGVSQCKSIIYDKKKYCFVVFDGTFVLKDDTYKANRIRLYTSSTKRVNKVRIG